MTISLKVPETLTVELLTVEETSADAVPDGAIVQSHRGTWPTRVGPRVVQRITPAGVRTITPAEVWSVPIARVSHLGGGGDIDTPAGVSITPAHAWAEHCHIAMLVGHMVDGYPVIRGPIASATLGPCERSRIGETVTDLEPGTVAVFHGLDTVGPWIFAAICAEHGGAVQFARRNGASILNNNDNQ